MVAERADETVAAIVAEGGVAVGCPVDVANRDDCARVVATAVDHYGRLDVLHKNVGIVSFQGIREVTEDDCNRTLAVNLTSMVLTTQAALPHLEAAGGGSIINVTSVAALRTYGPETAYQTAKAGIIGLTISLAGQLADKRIRVNALAPGQVWTPLVAGFLSDQMREERRMSGLIQDEGTAWDVAWGAVYLASDEARWVTGQVLVIDGGATLTMRGGNRPG
jgi:NAD(P)-dependent dehydrogenase (short-subunit alcohol dehydrogenase family)